MRDKHESEVSKTIDETNASIFISAVFIVLVNNWVAGYNEALSTRCPSPDKKAQPRSITYAEAKMQQISDLHLFQLLKFACKLTTEENLIFDIATLVIIWTTF